MPTKTGTVVPKTGTIVHPPLEHPLDHAKYAAMISAALRDDLGNTHRATKTVMQWTGASERAAKHWLAGTRGPSGEHLVMLVQHSDRVLTEFLTLAGRLNPDSVDALGQARAKVAELGQLLQSAEHLS